MSVPKKIYQTWYEKIFPKPIQNSIDVMLKVNKDYEYKLFDDNDMEEYIKNNFDYSVYSAFKMLTIGAAKADLWRYLILYKEGGVYIDVDSILYGKLDDLLYDDCAVITREGNPGKFVQWCLMFPSKHPILKICIDQCIKNIKNKTTSNILELTGPEVYSKSINKYYKDDYIYYKSDEEINSLKYNTKTRIHLVDYKGYANFLHPNKDLLHKNKVHWREEQKIKKVIVD